MVALLSIVFFILFYIMCINQCFIILFLYKYNIIRQFIFILRYFSIHQFLYIYKFNYMSIKIKDKSEY